MNYKYTRGYRSRNDNFRAAHIICVLQKAIRPSRRKKHPTLQLKKHYNSQQIVQKIVWFSPQLFNHWVKMLHWHNDQFRHPHSLLKHVLEEKHWSESTGTLSWPVVMGDGEWLDLCYNVAFTWPPLHISNFSPEVFTCKWRPDER